MALEVWSEIRFCNNVQFDKNIQIVPTIKLPIPQAQGMEIYSSGLRAGWVYSFQDSSNFKQRNLFIGIKDESEQPARFIFSYRDDVSCPQSVGLDSGGTFLANGFELYNGSTDTISKIYSPENNSLNFDHVTTLMYAKNTPTRESSGSKEQFCIQLDSSNGAVTLRNVPNDVPYITLYRPVANRSTTTLDYLYLQTYNDGKTSIGAALGALIRQGWIKHNTFVHGEEQDVNASYTKLLDKITMKLNIQAQKIKITQEETTLISHYTTNPYDLEYRMPNDCLPTENKIYTEIPIKYGSSYDTAPTGRATINVYSSGVVTLSNIQVLQLSGMVNEWVNYNPSKDNPIEIYQIGDKDTKYEWSSPLQYNFYF